MTCVMRRPFIFATFLLFNACAIDSIPTEHVETADLTCNNRASIEDVLSIVNKGTKGDLESVRIDPVVSVDGDTLMYFVNYHEGWKIISADKRTPMEIANGDTGNISTNTDNKGFLLWLGITSADMKRILYAADDLLNFTPEQIASHRKEWISDNDSNAQSRGGGGILPPIFIDETDWSLVEIQTEEVYVNHVDHLVGAHWDQLSPYNYYCPPKDSGTGNKPAGCAPVACAQMLQFLSTKFGMPQVVSLNGINVNMSDLYLPYTNTLIETSTPLLIRMIGEILGAHYGDNETSVLLPLSKIKTFFSNNAYSSTKQSYSVDKVKQNLGGGTPVIVSGYSGTILGLPDYTNGHTYLIDGYKKFKTKTTYYYERSIGDPPHIEYNQEIFYSTPHISKIKMNWGWWSQWENGANDGWYSLTGDWIVNVNGGQESFTEGVMILCDITFDYS